MFVSLMSVQKSERGVTQMNPKTVARATETAVALRTLSYLNLREVSHHNCVHFVLYLSDIITTVFILIERKLITILTFVQISGNGRHALH